MYMCMYIHVQCNTCTCVHVGILMCSVQLIASPVVLDHYNQFKPVYVLRLASASDFILNYILQLVDIIFFQSYLHVHVIEKNPEQTILDHKPSEYYSLQLSEYQDLWTCNSSLNTQILAETEALLQSSQIHIES